MIAETPSAVCTKRATAYRRKLMAGSRRLARICSRARVSGVDFFDFLHGQTGVAPNGIELHPVLGFACLASTEIGRLTAGSNGRGISAHEVG
jgi:hypothetical protein